MPGLRGADGRWLHEELVRVELDVVAVEQIGNDVNDGGMSGMVLQNVVLPGQPVELADFQFAGGGPGLAFANDLLGLNSLRGGVGFAAGDLVGAFTETGDVIGRQEVFDNEPAVTPEEVHLIGVECAADGTHR